MKTTTIPAVQSFNIVIDCADPNALAEFYIKLLGWEWKFHFANGWASITSSTGQIIAFQEIENYEPPVWPWKPGKQAQMMHLDFIVDNLQEGVAHALQCGATLADEQYFETSRTMFDPAGHTFCIDTHDPEQE